MRLVACANEPRLLEFNVVRKGSVPRTNIGYRNSLRGGHIALKNGCRGLVIVVGTLGAGLVHSGPVLAQAAYCESYARDYAARASRGGALGGAARGGIGGAIVGGIIDGGKGAGRGAGIGAIAGGVTRGVQSSTIYDKAFRDCMRRQGK